jgi:hypothetical protein
MNRGGRCAPWYCTIRKALPYGMVRVASSEYVHRAFFSTATRYSTISTVKTIVQKHSFNQNTPMCACCCSSYACMLMCRAHSVRQKIITVLVLLSYPRTLVGSMVIFLLSESLYCVLLEVPIITPDNSCLAFLAERAKE